MFIKEHYSAITKLIVLSILTILLGLGGCLEQCEVLTVINKYKCTFDRKFGARVCVAKLGRLEQLQTQGIRGRASATKLPEPLEVGETTVEVCTREGRKTYEKL